MNVTFCWMGISGYMGACWRALAAKEEVKLRVIAHTDPAANYSLDVVAGIDCTLLDPDNSRISNLVEHAVCERRNDVVVLPGWSQRHYRRLISVEALKDVKFVLAMDTPWQGGPRQQLARLALRGYASRMSMVAVSGERCGWYARKLGVAPAKIRKGLYGIDGQLWSRCLTAREADGCHWPRSFLYVGRFEQVKGIAALLESYSQYRRQVSDPWPLVMCGTGSLAGWARGAEGVDYRGFVQPQDLQAIFASAGVFVLPSMYDPWPLVLVEACSSGLPVIHSNACGSSVELIRPYYNGLSVATGDIASLVEALKWCHAHHADLPVMGARARLAAEAYNADHWARRWHEWLKGLVQKNRAALTA